MTLCVCVCVCEVSGDGVRVLSDRVWHGWV